MRQLRLVRLAEDATHLHLQSEDGAAYALPVDDSLRRILQPVPESASGSVRSISPGSDRAGPEAAPPPAPAREVEIKPREIQVRVRAGESPEDVAASLGVDPGRIARFAAPVVEERQRIAGEARRARARRPEGSENVLVVFGEAVDARFTAHGIPAADVDWDARRRDDGDWIVTAEWLGGQGRHSAEWVFHRTSRTVTPLDDAASDLLSDRPIRPFVAPEPESIRPSLAAAPPLAPGVVAFPPMADANTGPLPRYEEVFDQDAAPDGPRNVPPYVPEPVAAADPPPAELDFDAPPLPLGITDPSERPGALASLTTIGRVKRNEPEVERDARARVPSWDDILLGVRRNKD